MLSEPRGFEQLVTDALNRLEAKVDVLTNEVGIMKAAQQIEKVRRERIARPLEDWGLQDSIALKAVLEREKRRKPTAEEEQAQENRDRKRRRFRDSLQLIGIGVAVVQSLFNPLGAAWHLVHKGTP